MKDLLFPQLMALLSKPSRSVDIVSAYFVPGKEFSDALEQQARAGIRVRILTNSQAATDVVAVHSAYVRSEEHTSELQSLMRISYADFSLKTEMTDAHVRPET